MPESSSNFSERASTLARRAARRARKQVNQWRRASAPSSAESGEGTPLIGMVEEMTPKIITGWVASGKDSEPVRVTLRLNGREIAHSFAVKPIERANWGEARAFTFRLNDVWRFMRKGDRLTVRLEDRQALPIHGVGVCWRATKSGNRTPKELFELLTQGHVFSHSGRLQLSKDLDATWQGSMLGLQDRVHAAVRDATGYETFLVYGSLLGAVRGGTFIGHDMDLDVAYISKHNDGPAAAAELRDLGLALIARGFEVLCKRTALHIYDGPDKKNRVDIFHLYFDGAGRLQMPFGYAGTNEVTKADWQGLKPTQFAGTTCLIPVNAEQFVEHMYGDTWRTPRPDFNWSTDRTALAREGWTTEPQRQEIYWANFYAQHQYTAGSTFFELVHSRPDTAGTIVDIGCGDGRDSLAFATAERRVFALDRSPVAVEHATKRAGELGLSDRATFLECDVTRLEQVRSVVQQAQAAAGDAPVQYYLRFFLHSIPENVQTKLMESLASLARPGDLLAAEFRSTEDEALSKVHGGHYRRYQSGALFRENLTTRYGFSEVLFEQEGQGLSIYKDEDPYLYRIVARRP